VSRARRIAYVPTLVRRSRTVTWLWQHSEAGGWLDYERAKWLARWLP
jgi:hypothetical protein